MLQPLSVAARYATSYWRSQWYLQPQTCRRATGTPSSFCLPPFALSSGMYRGERGGVRCEKGVGHAVGTGRDAQGSTLYTPEFWDAVYHCWSAMLQSTCSSDACVLVARNTAIAAECEVLIIDVCVCYRATRASVKNRPMVSICTNVGNNIHRSGYSLMTAEFQAHRCSALKMNNTSTLIRIAMVHLGMTVHLTNTVEHQKQRFELGSFLRVRGRTVKLTMAYVALRKCNR